ncbi:MAG TPA: NAD(P)-dependent oxidoreductase, partial [Phycisphaerales bacterium]|nr:NAD(P)-dependent oxidoreductase [Phycisphaerales bacterium]
RQGATEVSLEELQASSDVVSLHVDARSENDGFVGRAFLGRLKRDVIIINTSRGRVADPEALAGFLRDNPEALALLDVHAHEPFDETYPLLHCPNAFLSPHIAAATRLANERMSWVVEDVWRVLCGQAPTHAAEGQK